MLRRSLAALALVLAAGCEKEVAAPQIDPCVMPTFTGTHAAGTAMGEKERVTFCVKHAAYALAAKGGPLEPIAAQAVAQCAAAEEAQLAAARKEGPLYDYQIPIMHEALVNNAKRAAVQARATGCGRRPGERPDTVDSD